MRQVVVSSVVDVIGSIWQPGFTECAMRYSWSSYDVEHARDDNGNLTRKSVERWLLLNSGDFQSITDFCCDLADNDKDFISEWQNSDSEFIFNDCMFGDEF